MSSAKYWDEGWKILLDPEMPWFNDIFGRLLPEVPRDFDVDFGEDIGSQLRHLNGETHYGGHHLFADCLLEVCTDEKHRKVHIEFQSTHDDRIGLRMLHYGLANMNYHEVRGNCECYYLPKAYIISVRPEARYPFSTRQVCLYKHNEDSPDGVLRWPVIRAYERLYEVRQLLQAKTVSEVSSIVEGWAEKFAGTGDRNSSYYDDFSRACIYISNSKAFKETGIKEEEVQEMTKHRDWEGKPSLRDSWIQEGIEKGFQEHTRDLLTRWRVQGIPKETALKLIGVQGKDLVEEIYGSDKPSIKGLNID